MGQRLTCTIIMGACICKDNNEEDQHCDNVYSDNSSSLRSVQVSSNDFDHSMIDSLILETLSIIRTLVDNIQEPPVSMIKLHFIADQENGWLAVVNSLVRVVPMGHPLGPAVITLLLYECPLPTKESVASLVNFFGLVPNSAVRTPSVANYHRNACVVLGCIAEKMAGPGSIALFSENTLKYLVSNLNPCVNPSVLLFSLLALEKFSQTSENKNAVNRYLAKDDHIQLTNLEFWARSSDYVQRQVAFCAQWCLDNICTKHTKPLASRSTGQTLTALKLMNKDIIKPGRVLTYLTLDKTNLNAMLNCNDVSECLKISANGLEARCDTSSFESVRCTFPVDKGTWFYEVTVVTSGVMQIGWATKDSKFLNHDGYGIGDDEFSLAYDGCRQLIWYNATSRPHLHPPWQPGDVLGTLLDTEAPCIVFYLNGIPLPETFDDVFNNAKNGFFAAASFMSFQHCEFNFGLTLFKFPPKGRTFHCFNDYASLSDSEKIILPRHIKLRLLSQAPFKEDSCTLCFDLKATISLDPCGHTGFCTKCALLLELCPMCRSTIGKRVETNTNSDDVGED